MKDIAIGTKATGSIIKMKQMLNIMKGVVSTNDSNWLKKNWRSTEFSHLNG